MNILLLMNLILIKNKYFLFYLILFYYYILIANILELEVANETDFDNIKISLFI